MSILQNARCQAASMEPPGAPWALVLDLEDVGEVRSVQELHAQRALHLAVVPDDDVLVHSVGHDPLPLDRHRGVLSDAGGGERPEDGRRVVLQIAAGQHPHGGAVDQHTPPRQMGARPGRRSPPPPFRPRRPTCWRRRTCSRRARRGSPASGPHSNQLRCIAEELTASHSLAHHLVCHARGAIRSSAAAGPHDPAGYGWTGPGCSRAEVTISHARSTPSSRVNRVWSPAMASRRSRS